MQSANNMGGVRGDLEMESPFLTIYEAEQDITRELGDLEPVNPDDFKIEENIVYAAALLKNFCQNKKILLDEEEDEEDEECFALRAVEINEENDTFNVKYENSFNVDGQEFTENMDIAIKFGKSKDEKLTVCCEHISGSRLYFKKAAKEVKSLFEYCRK